MRPLYLSPSTPLRALSWRAGVLTAGPREIAEERPVALHYGGAPYAVLMATPANIEDLATGFTLTEGVAAYGDIERVIVDAHPQGYVADVLLSAPARLRRRNLASNSSCGLCGVEKLEEALRPLPRAPAGPPFTHEALARALAALEGEQDLGRLTRATHAAAWARADGSLALVREDVGRHNALDKLIGAAARAGLDPGVAMILVTSRCSYEMVEKTAVAGVRLIAAISAPTALAIEKAEQAGITLVALARADGHMIFAHPEGLAALEPAS